MDTCLSMYFQDFVEGHAFTRDLAEIGRVYCQYQQVMKHWASVLGHPVLLLPYEELVTDQGSWTRQPVSFCDLPWDDCCLSFHEQRQLVRTASSEQVRRPIYTSSLNRWRNYEQFLSPLKSPWLHMLADLIRHPV